MGTWVEWGGEGRGGGGARAHSGNEKKVRPSAAAAGYGSRFMWPDSVHDRYQLVCFFPLLIFVSFPRDGCHGRSVLACMKDSSIRMP